MSLIPICFYPFNKIIVDDDQAFSQSVLFKMPGENFASYTSPSDALSYLSNYKPQLSKSDLISNNPHIEETARQHIVNFNIDRLVKSQSLPDLSDISVILVDYHMPEMTGIEFLKKISHLPIKKALITGENDYKIAVDSFNSGLIDAYLRKDDPEFASKITKIVSELEWKYFTDLSSFIYDIPEFNFLNNPNLLSIFQKYLDENAIKSFCLVDSHGTFLVKNRNNQISHFLIRKRNYLDTMTRTAEEDGASDEIIQHLKQEKFIPFFGLIEYWQIPAHQWKDYLYPAMKVSGEPDLLWAIAK